MAVSFTESVKPHLTVLHFDYSERAEFLLEHGMLDAVVPRKEMKAYIARAFEFMTRAA